jgi:ribosomal-protein-alanine N-acetyltransferase
MTLAWLDEVMRIEAEAYAFPWTRGNFVDSLAAGHPMQCLVGASGQLLGYVVTMPGVDEVHILNITVAPTQQGRGYARRMLHTVMSEARRSGAAFVWLEVRPSNARARDLYESLGFHDVGVRRGYYPAPGHKREDALVMRRALGAGPAGAPPHAVD